ncbi:MAG: recombinase family protein [Acidaminococcaceae bacterium]|nr:recombinase family protein [Acidaminococcaceae bacterium]
MLTKYKRKTKLGNTKWSPGSIGDVIANERHVGDILARKTYTPNFKDHKSKINRKNRTQYRRRDNHASIVSRPVFDAAVKLQA